MLAAVMRQFVGKMVSRALLPRNLHSTSHSHGLAADASDRWLSNLAQSQHQYSDNHLATRGELLSCKNVYSQLSNSIASGYHNDRRPVKSTHHQSRPGLPGKHSNVWKESRPLLSEPSTSTLALRTRCSILMPLPQIRALPSWIGA